MAYCWRIFSREQNLRFPISWAWYGRRLDKTWNIVSSIDLKDLVQLKTNVYGVNCLQGHVTFDENGNRETLVQITQNKRE